MASCRDKRFVYHLTALTNLPGIVERGLLSRRDVQRVGLDPVDVADEEILSGRANHDLDAMVPCHFMAKNPSDYAVVRNHLSTPFCLLAVYRDRARALGWSIIPRHPLSGTEPEILAWDEGIDRIDWEQFDRPDRDYRDRECKLVCMAEALSPCTVPLSEVRQLFLPSAEFEGWVRQNLGRPPHPRVTVNERMFPGGCR